MSQDSICAGREQAFRRVVIMGQPGSGKSTLARCLGARLGLPVFHLDNAFWQPGWVQASPEQFRDAVSGMASLPAWVIDGNYTQTLQVRLAAADTVIYLDLPRWRCMWRIVRRMIAGRGKERTDLAAGCPEKIDFAFLKYAWNWNANRREKNLALIASFKGRRVIMRSNELPPEILAAVETDA